MDRRTKEKRQEALTVVASKREVFDYREKSETLVEWSSGLGIRFKRCRSYYEHDAGRCVRVFEALA